MTSRWTFSLIIVTLDLKSVPYNFSLIIIATFNFANASSIKCWLACNIANALPVLWWNISLSTFMPRLRSVLHFWMPVLSARGYWPRRPGAPIHPHTNHVLHWPLDPVRSHINWSISQRWNENKWKATASLALWCIPALVSGVNCLARPPGSSAGNRCLLNPSLQIGFEGRKFQSTEREKEEREKEREGVRQQVLRRNICFDRRVD